MSFEDRRIEHIQETRIQDLKPKEKHRPKDEPSQFDRVLRESAQQPFKPLVRSQTELATHQGVRETKRFQEQKEEKRKKEKGEEEGKEETKSREKGRDGKVAEQKVIAKSKSNQGQRESHSGSHGREGFGGQAGKRRGASLNFKTGDAKAQAIIADGRFQQQLKAKLTQASQSPQMTQAILNKIVQSVRAGLNEKGEKEIQIDLHKEILKGLKLRVISRNGRVSVLFQSEDHQVRKLVEQHQEEISKALVEKGIEVAEIRVN